MRRYNRGKPYAFATAKTTTFFATAIAAILANSGTTIFEALPEDDYDGVD
eukprot:m.108729 g.108729  ORF g.108729 m.108729 type:complete len:50 (-) comp51749_c0_seq3:30-179(-)